MADQSDVEAALARVVEAALYPAGLAAPSVLGRMVRIFRGWPVAAALDRDLAAGFVNISVFPEVQRQLNTTRWLDQTIATSRETPTIAITVVGDTATLTGQARPGQVAGLLADNIAVVHRVESGDTLSAVAAVLGSYLRTRRPALVDGASIRVPGAGLLVGRVVVDQQALRELRRQRQMFRVTCWCPDPDTRDAAGAAVDRALSAQGFVELPDGTRGQIRFSSSTLIDEGQHATLYRRDLIYSVEYATTAMEIRPSMIFGNARFALGDADMVHSLLG